MAPSPLYSERSATKMPGLVKLLKSVSQNERSRPVTPSEPLRSNAETVGDLISVPLAKILPVCRSEVGEPPTDPPSTVKETSPEAFVNLRTVFAAQLTIETFPS